MVVRSEQAKGHRLGAPLAEARVDLCMEPPKNGVKGAVW
jgi:hypothetical protein